jgi:hypothetical protein
MSDPQAHFAEAEMLLLSGYAGLKTRVGEQAQRTVEARQRMAKLYGGLEQVRISAAALRNVPGPTKAEAYQTGSGSLRRATDLPTHSLTPLRAALIMLVSALLGIVA